MNGEVYNFADLPCDLDRENRRFRGGSDTEVVLEACEAWGVERAVSKFIVMFAFAFWTCTLGASLWFATASASSRSTGAAQAG